MSEKETITSNNSLSNEENNTPLRSASYGVIRTLLVGFMAVSIINAMFSYIFYTPKAHRINLENNELVAQYQLLESQIANAEERIAEIAYRDNHIYRTLFGVDTLPLLSKRTPYPEAYYEELDGDPYSPILISAWRKIDMLSKGIYEQSLSLDELQRLAKNKEELAGAIPAVWPIDRSALKARISAFGMRQHPIYKRYIMHKGVDLACDTGTPIYATADGVVQSSEQGYRRSGYGQMILLKHDFGYQTRYGHMSKRLVNRGDTVRRGEVIGLVGSTGGSTGPHLHYEVISRGQVVNPLNFFNRNMTRDEYKQLMESVQSANFERIDE